MAVGTVYSQTGEVLMSTGGSTIGRIALRDAELLDVPSFVVASGRSFGFLTQLGTFKAVDRC